MSDEQPSAVEQFSQNVLARGSGLLLFHFDLAGHVGIGGAVKKVRPRRIKSAVIGFTQRHVPRIECRSRFYRI